MKEAWLIGALFVAGCGDISSADSLFSPGAGGAPSGGSQGGESPSSSNVGGMSSTSVVSPTSTSTGPSVTSSTGTDIGVTSTTVASTTVSASVSSSMASTGTGSGPTLPCGDTTCPKGGDNACCSYIFNQGGGPTFSCTTTDSTDCDMDQFETLVTCQTSADCDLGQTCCGHRRIGQSGQGGPTYYDHVSCQSSCTWPEGVTLCDPNGIDLTQCPFVQNQGNTVATHCQPSQLLPHDYDVCSP